MVRGVRGGWAGQRWADTREGQSRERAVVWPHGGFPSQGLGGPASSHRKPPFSVRGWGARAQPLQAEAAEGLWAGALNVHPVPSLPHFANAHITRFPWRPASLREGSVEGPSERTRGKEQLGSGRRVTPRRGLPGSSAALRRAFLAPLGWCASVPSSSPEGGREGTRRGLHPLTHWRSDTRPEARGAGGAQASRVLLWWDPDAVCLSCFLPEKWPAGRPPGCVNSHFLAV